MAASERYSKFWHRPVIRSTAFIVLLAFLILLIVCTIAYCFLSPLLVDYPPQIHPAATVITSQSYETTRCNIIIYKVNAPYADVVDYYLAVLAPEPYVSVYQTTDQTSIEVTECFDCFGMFATNLYLLRPIDRTTTSLETRTCK